MKHRPEDFHGLTADEADQMVASGLTRAEWDRSRLRVAHGDLVSALIHLRRALGYFERNHPATAAWVTPLAERLAAQIPDYTAFAAAMTPRFPRLTQRH
jgi:hypothetical protein